MQPLKPLNQSAFEKHINHLTDDLANYATFLVHHLNECKFFSKEIYDRLTTLKYSLHLTNYELAGELEPTVPLLSWVSKKDIEQNQLDKQQQIKVFKERLDLTKIQLKEHELKLIASTAQIREQEQMAKSVCEQVYKILDNCKGYAYHLQQQINQQNRLYEKSKALSDYDKLKVYHDQQKFVEAVQGQLTTIVTEYKSLNNHANTLANHQEKLINCLTKQFDKQDEFLEKYAFLFSHHYDFENFYNALKSQTIFELTLLDSTELSEKLLNQSGLILKTVNSRYLGH